MNLSDAVDATLATLRCRPGDLLPLYLLAPAIPIITRVISFTGIVLAFVYLESTNRAEAIRTELTLLDLEPPSPEAEPEVFAEWAESLIPVFELLFPPTVRFILATTVVVSILASVILSAGLLAGQLTACYARLNTTRGLTAGIQGVRQFWLPILLTRLLEFFLWLAATILAGIVLFGAFTISPLLALLVGLPTVFVWVALGALIRAIFVFVPVAIVVDESGPLAGIQGSVGFIRQNVVEAVGYYVLAIGVFLVLISLAAMVAPLGAAGLVTIAGIVLVSPAFDLLKTALYGDFAGSVSPPAASEQRIRDQSVNGLRRGWRHLIEFVRATPILHLVAAGFLAAGFALGWAAAGPFEELLTTSIEARLEGFIPPVAALEIGANNWLVTLTMAYAGIGIGIPTAVSLGFNGFVFGAVARLEVAPLELLLFVIPHGIIEIPALLIAGALGLSLGVTTWRTARGHTSRDALADALEDAFWILIGVGLLIALAAIIEGFISPYYYRLLL